MSIMCDHPKTTPVKKSAEQELLKCSRCGLIFNPALVEKEHAFDVYLDYYAREYPQRFNFVGELSVLFFRFLRAVELKAIRFRIKSILDVGCGRGFFLYILKRYFGVKIADGTQIEDNSYKYAKNVLKLNIYKEDMPAIELPAVHYDAVTYWHVLEHLQKPEEHLQEAYRILKPKGLLLLETPNYQAWSRFLTGNSWLSYDVQNHIFFFTKDSLKALVERCGFKLKCYSSFSFEYATFTSCQSILNKITGSRDKFYLWIQNKETFSATILLHCILLIPLASLCFIVNVVLSFTKYGEVNHCVFEKS
jgi:2-polyprenyl-3-methyl-5-hydroxy-6-metoxy-1,4-benzoquinol methylase